jgi:hypothetical protein
MIVAQPVMNFEILVESENSLPFSQQPVIGSYYESVESSSHTISLRFILIALLFQIVKFPWSFPNKVRLYTEADKKVLNKYHRPSHYKTKRVDKSHFPSWNRAHKPYVTVIDDRANEPCSFTFKYSFSPLN